MYVQEIPPGSASAAFDRDLQCVLLHHLHPLVLAFIGIMLSSFAASMGPVVIDLRDSSSDSDDDVVLWVLPSPPALMSSHRLSLSPQPFVLEQPVRLSPVRLSPTRQPLVLHQPMGPLLPCQSLMLRHFLWHVQCADGDPFDDGAALADIPGVPPTEYNYVFSICPRAADLIQLMSPDQPLSLDFKVDLVKDSSTIALVTMPDVLNKIVRLAEMTVDAKVGEKRFLCTAFGTTLSRLCWTWECASRSSHHKSIPLSLMAAVRSPRAPFSTLAASLTDQTSQCACGCAHVVRMWFHATRGAHFPTAPSSSPMRCRDHCEAPFSAVDQGKPSWYQGARISKLLDLVFEFFDKHATSSVGGTNEYSGRQC
ncbi:hypothetical protein BCR44DRAFT_34241 [Catenaria anguillulae PL171]|uniref:Uncharacterized protein n=1 Tax=Catenaria anguillulae PL171 TaxID=765915 RepID=A0A1Y2HL50_9FUNG|nr:hypothetical protein BCR44DRAFT_34241 [Catenaria anguillulae PL171]